MCHDWFVDDVTRMWVGVEESLKRKKFWKKRRFFDESFDTNIEIYSNFKNFEFFFKTVKFFFKTFEVFIPKFIQKISKFVQKFQISDSTVSTQLALRCNLVGFHKGSYTFVTSGNTTDKLIAHISVRLVVDVFLSHLR